MKSTGLFGKNSGRVGGVVYSNYRGEQIVRAYQPKVSNPNTMGQVAQRAKFKLVSQVGASLGREIKMSFVPSVAKESPRNAFVKAMLKKTTYSNNEASLPIEDIVLTNSRESGFLSLSATNQAITGVISPSYSTNAKVKVVVIAYNSGGEISLIGSIEPTLTLSEEGVLGFTEVLGFMVEPPSIQGYTNMRVLAYVYEPDTTAGTNYEDYEVLEEEATLQDVLKVFAGRVNFSATENILIPQNV